MYESLTKCQPELEKAEGYGDWIVDRRSKGKLDDPIQIPYVNYGMTVADVEWATARGSRSAALKHASSSHERAAQPPRHPQ